MQSHPHPPAHPGRKADLLKRLRGCPAAWRHGGAATGATALALLPVFGLPVTPAGQPFLPVLAIISAAFLFGYGSAAAAALAASLVAALLMLADGGFSGADAPRAALSLLAFLMVAFGMAAAAEAMRGIFALMDGADERRRAGIAVPAAAPSARMQALRLLTLSPEERRAVPRPR
ncbi:hypothetical protein DFH01_10650 [Falsiroseomonas bella]|uniref:Uncharacterized protein n=1 Tax=Falsiroseomonas bella TaxID=2184016 RepID=A0A317FG07_9PROT|nr:hypothetical protein [Falsiroseomonas bella]PWS37302.1 hypothetical protein DFH01_10650 [Falsiroseomonas bella]